MAKINLLEIYWSDKAKVTFQETINYLSKNWTTKEIETFVTKSFHLISLISSNPKIFKQSIKRKHVHLEVIDKNNLLIYRYKPNNNTIELLIFWSAKQSPQKLKY